MSATETCPDTELRHCWQAITTADGFTVCGTVDAGWYVLGRLNQVLRKYPDDGGVVHALIRYRKECHDLTDHPLTH